ncbi:MAG: prolipoprotein diacylglyceryl transferase [Candidatus Margulisiibacteriota bacterium]|jgi:phosphatidylglycerol:prolipoprotein diacylglycerol transferase
MFKYPHIDPNIISLGPFKIRWYGFMYILGLIIGFLIVRKELMGPRLRFNYDQMVNLALYIMIGIIIGGRIGYILIYDSLFYIKSPFEIFAFWHGGMSYHGGAIGALIAIFLFSKRHQKNLLLLLDLAAIGSTPGLFLGRIGNFINGELFGRVTNKPWGMIFPLGGDLPRHPSQLYEATFEGIVLFLILYFLWRPGRLKAGYLFVCYLILYGAFRFFLEFLREPDIQLGLFANFISMGQIWCLLMMLLGVVTFIYLKFFLYTQKT